MSVDRWKSRVTSSPNNEWAVFELCKALEHSGQFDGHTETEQYGILERICLELGASRKAIFEGWQEYRSVRKPA